MSIYFLSYHAIPKETNVPEVGGAYINCWIDAADLETAKNISTNKIKDLNWQINNLEESYLVSEKEYENKPEGLEYYQQAKLDKEVYVLHTYPVED